MGDLFTYAHTHTHHMQRGIHAIFLNQRPSYLKLSPFSGTEATVVLRPPLFFFREGVLFRLFPMGIGGMH